MGRSIKGWGGLWIRHARQVECRAVTSLDGRMMNIWLSVHSLVVGFGGRPPWLRFDRPLRHSGKNWIHQTLLSMLTCGRVMKSSLPWPKRQVLACDGRYELTYPTSPKANFKPASPRSERPRKESEGSSL